jgi:hypothetical protein
VRAAGEAAARGDGGGLPAARKLLNQWFTPLEAAIKCAAQPGCLRLSLHSPDARVLVRRVEKANIDEMVGGSDRHSNYGLYLNVLTVRHAMPALPLEHPG